MSKVWPHCDGGLWECPVEGYNWCIKCDDKCDTCGTLQADRVAYCSFCGNGGNFDDLRAAGGVCAKPDECHWKG